MLPSRSECILHAKPPRGYSDQLVMVSPLDSSPTSDFVIAFTLSSVDNGKVPVRVMNPSESPIQLFKGQKIAQCMPVVETAAFSSKSSVSEICASVTSGSVMDPSTLTELESAINPRLPAEDKRTLLHTLLRFPDVFNNGQGHTEITTHKIDTGDSPPIRQYPRRLPYHFRTEVDKQVKEMLSQGVI